MVLGALAATAASALVQAIVTDGWQGARHKVARLFGRGNPDLAIERRVDATRGELVAAAPAQLDQVRTELAAAWRTRFEDLLADHPGAEAEVNTLIKDLQPMIASAGAHSVVAAGDVQVKADRGGIAAGVIHGDVMPPGPPPPDLADG